MTLDAAMGSQALATWEGTRQQRIDELLAAHTAYGGAGPGRRWRTQQLNWALVLRVAGEFQGFARDLHDEASDFFATQAAQLNSQLELPIRVLLTNGRQLDRGNAHPGSLGNDFNRFGFQLWAALDNASARSAEWNTRLTALNDARNAIAHDDAPKLAVLKASGHDVNQLDTMKKFRTTTSQLSRALDRVVGDHLKQLFGGAPW